MKAHADGRVLVDPDNDLALGKNPPAKRLRPEPGQAGQVVGVNDDVVKSDRHADTMRGTLGGIPVTPHSSDPNRVRSSAAVRADGRPVVRRILRLAGYRYVR